MFRIILKAIQKRNKIIEREGTAGGARLTPEYLAQLIEEITLQEQAENKFSGIKNENKLYSLQ